jgi:hypothetical protein
VSFAYSCGTTSLSACTAGVSTVSGRGPWQCGNSAVTHLCLALLQPRSLASQDHSMSYEESSKGPAAHQALPCQIEHHLPEGWKPSATCGCGPHPLLLHFPIPTSARAAILTSLKASLSRARLCDAVTILIDTPTGNGAPQLPNPTQHPPLPLVQCQEPKEALGTVQVLRLALDPSTI